MSNIRRRRRQAQSPIDALLTQNFTAVAATTDTGYETYGLPNGRLFLPAGTNYLTDPNMEAWSGGSAALPDGWESTGTTVTGTPAFSRVTGRDGGYAIRVQYTGVAGDDGTRRLRIRSDSAAASFASGDPSIFSVHVKGSISGCQLNLYTESKTAADAHVGGEATLFTGATSWADWTRYAAADASAGATTDHLHAMLQFDGVGVGDTIDVTFDQCVLEKSSILTPYFDGSSSDSLNANTYAWTAAANASTSTRVSSALAIPITLGSTAWTIAGRYAALWAHNDAAAHNLLTLMAGADARATVYKHTDQKLYASVTDGTDTATSASAAQTLAAATANSFVARSTWAGTVDLMLNGAASTQGNASAVGAQTIDSIVIGGTPVAYQGPLVVSPVDKGASWAVAVDALLRASSVDLYSLAANYMASGDALFTGRQADGGTLYVKR